ncbi:MAG: WbqC family protein [Mediterranea sp.]|nr:WbqC family protein [Mediterranea sp.]
MKTIYLISSYLAPIQYYTKLLMYDKICMEQYDCYSKQTYRNRCTISVPNGTSVLSIPVVHSSNSKCLMKDVRISDHGNWQHIHWNAIESAYGNTPFFEYYKDDFRPFYENKYLFLIDFNEELCQLICKLIDIAPIVERTVKYKTGLLPDEYDFREIIHPKKDLREDPEFIPYPYYQVFENRQGFIPNLSIIDLLFNMGSESLLVLLKSMPMPILLQEPQASFYISPDRSKS